MKRVLVLLVLGVLGVALPLAVTSKPVAAQEPSTLPGPYEAADDVMNCNFAWTGPTEWPPSASYNFDDGSVVLYRCYMTPVTTGYFEFVSFTARIAGNSGQFFDIVQNGAQCYEAGETDFALGQFVATCVALPGTYQLPLSEVKPGAGILLYRDAPGGPIKKKDHFPYSNVNTGLTSNWVNDGMCPDETNFRGCPSWPARWPIGATERIGPNGNGSLPELDCRNGVRLDADGVIRAKFNGLIKNPDENAEDVGFWQYEWEATTPRTRHDPWTWQHFTGAPPHPGSLQDDVPVPTADMPPGGWKAQYVVVRHYEEPVFAGYANEWNEIATADWLESKRGVFDTIGNWLGTLLATDDEQWSVNLNAPPGPDAPSFLVRERVAHGIKEWETAAVSCNVKVRPNRAGTPEGTQEGTTRPNPPPSGGGGGGGEPEEPGEGGGEGGGCETPEGWSMLNPVAWVGAAGCALGDFLTGLIADLLELLTKLFIPTGSISDRLNEIAEAIDETGFGTIGAAVSDTSTGVTTAIGSSTGGGCQGPQMTVPSFMGSDEIATPAFDACNGVGLTVRNVVHIMVKAFVVLFGFKTIYNAFARLFGIQQESTDGV